MSEIRYAFYPEMHQCILSTKGERALLQWSLCGPVRHR